MNSAIPASKRDVLADAIVLIVAILGTFALACAYAGSDGGAWVGQLLDYLRDFQNLLGLAAAIAILAGAAAALLAGGTTRNHHVIGLLAATSAIMIAAQGDIANKAAAWLGFSDWFRVLSLLLTGSAWGIGWSAGSRLAKSQPSRWAFLLPFLALAAASAVLSGTGRAAFGLAWLSVLAPAAGGWLWHAIRRRRAEKEASRPHALVPFALGLALLGALAYAMGFAGIARAPILIGALAVLTLALWRGVMEVIGAGARWLTRPAPVSPWPALLCAFIASVLLVQWIAAAGPEIGGDAIGGRVALPAIWLHQGRIAAHPEIEISYMGLGGEAFYLLWLPVMGFSVAKIVALLCQVQLLRMIISGRHRPMSTWSLATAAALGSSTIMWWQFSWGFCDLLQATLMVAAAEALRKWLHSENRQHAMAAGLLAGAATAVKLNGVLIAAAVSAVPFLVVFWRRRRVTDALKAALPAAIPAATVIAPSLIRSAMLTGNPVFPFANGLFRSPLAPTDLAAIHFGLPFRQAVWQDAYRVFLDPGTFVEVGTYHPLLLPMIAGCAVASALAFRRARYWVGAFLVSALFWMLSEQNLRYSLFVGLFAALAIVHSQPATVIPMRGRWLRAVGGGLLAVTVVTGTVAELARPSFWLGGASEGQFLPLSWAFGGETSETYLYRNYAMYPIAKAMNSVTGPSTRVWQMPWLRDHLYFEAPVVSMPHADIRLMAPLRTLMPDEVGGLKPDQIAAALHRSGITNLVMTDSNPWEGNDPESAWTAIYGPQFTLAWLEPMAANQDLRLYRVRDHPIGPNLVAVPLAEFPMIAGAHDYSVTPGRLYEFKLSPLPMDGAGDTIGFAWFDAAGKQVDIQFHQLPRAIPGGWHRWLQTAAPSACRLEVQIHQSHPATVLTIGVLPAAGTGQGKA